MLFLEKFGCGDCWQLESSCQNRAAELIKKGEKTKDFNSEILSNVAASLGKDLRALLATKSCSFIFARVMHRAYFFVPSLNLPICAFQSALRYPIGLSRKFLPLVVNTSFFINGQETNGQWATKRTFGNPPRR